MFHNKKIELHEGWTDHYSSSFDLGQTLDHHLPEVPHVYLLAYDCVEWTMQEVAVRASSGRAFELDLDVSFSAFEVFRSEQVVNRAWVVDSGIVEILILFVLLLEVPEEGSQFLPK